jgi:hypothetical protein
MLGSPDSVREARAAIYHQFQKKEIASDEAVSRLREIEPASPLAAVMLATSLYEAGDLEGAERELWTAVAGAPCIAGGWFRLAAIYDQRAEDQRAALPFRILGLRQLGVSDEIPEEAVAMFHELGDAARVPASYDALAGRAEEALGDFPWPDSLRPYRLLREIQRGAAFTGLDVETLEEALEHYEECEPVFRAALREWSDTDGETLSDEAASLLLAILGERGAPALIDDLVDDQQYPTTDVLNHAQWAVWRIGQRHPAEAFERLQAAAVAADPSLRGFLAEQFYLLPETVGGRKEAILNLLDGFSVTGDDVDDAAYLLTTVSFLLCELGDAYNARAVVEKHLRSLPEEGRGAVREALDSENVFLPHLWSDEIEGLTILDICCSSALLEGLDEEGEEEDEEEDDHDHDHDHDHSPIRRELRPGRNDECWCGSGKKYKKCHLASDEEEDRAEAGPVAEIARMMEDIMATVIARMNRSDTAHAHRLFFDCDAGMLDFDDNEDAHAAFVEWLILDYRFESTGRTALEEYRRRRGRIPEQDRPVFDAFRNARYAVWEVVRVEPRRGLEVKNRFTGETIFVHDLHAQEDYSTGDTLIAYILDAGSRPLFFADSLVVPEALVPRLLEAVEAGAREAGVAPAEYFRSRSHQWRRLTESWGLASA